MRAEPVKEKVRAVGSQKERSSVGSTSDRGGVPELRSRVMTRLSRSPNDEVPAARSRSSGMASISWTFTPGMPTSANPTELPWPMGGVGPVVVTPVTVMRRVRKVRGGKDTTWPAAVFDAGPRRTDTG